MTTRGSVAHPPPTKTKALGGGSSAVAASAHAACARFRGTDPLITGRTRRNLAVELGHPDISAGIPEARWMRAMTFERLVRDERFASQTATATVGALDLDRPTEVVLANARVSTERTADLLVAAHDRALADGAATLLHQPAVPFVGYEDTRATDVKPDFAVVARKRDRSGTWLVMGDAKDYERHRSRVEDTRLLKGFLQVAVGAESAAAWSLLPDGMEVHGYGALAVPRNDCILPFFDRTTAVQVVRYLTGQIPDMPGGAGRKVLVDGRELGPNPAIPQSVWDLWETLPSQTMPQRGARAVVRLTNLAQALSADAIRPDALKAVTARLIPLLHEFATTYAGALDQAIEEIWDVHVKEILGKVGGTTLTYSDFVVRADDRAIRTGFRFASRAFGGDVARAYVDHLAPGDDDDDEIRDALVKAWALAAMREVRGRIDGAASELADTWYTDFHGAIHGLSDERLQRYEEIRGQAVDPQQGYLGKPRTRMEDYAVLDPETGKTSPAPLLAGHLMADGDGMFPVTGLNPWEVGVVETEMARPGALGWYRNPSRPAVDSLTIAYRDPQGDWRSMHPDFVFFHKVDGAVRASIVDPHGHHLDDAREKLLALAAFAEKYGDHFDRIEQVSQFGNVRRTIPLHTEFARDGLKRTGLSVMELYYADFALDYDHDVPETRR